MKAWKEQTYQNKFKLLLGFLALLLLIIYLLNFKKTIELVKSNKNKKTEYQETINTPMQLKSFESRLESLNQFLGSSFECSELPEKIIEFTNSVPKYNVSLIDIQQKSDQTNENMTVCDFSIILTGSYINLLKYIYELETEQKIGRITSADFKTETDRNKRKRLLVEIYIQNIEIN